MKNKILKKSYKFIEILCFLENTKIMEFFLNRLSKSIYEMWKTDEKSKIIKKE